MLKSPVLIRAEPTHDGSPGWGKRTRCAEDIMDRQLSELDRVCGFWFNERDMRQRTLIHVTTLLLFPEVHKMKVVEVEYSSVAVK